MLSASVQAQNLQLNSHDANTDANSTYLHEVKAGVQLTNTGTSANYDVARIFNGSTGVLDSNYFCWDLCYGVGVDSSFIGGVYLENNVSNSDFYIGVYIRGDNAMAQDSLVYRFYHPTNPNDNLDVTFYISVSPTASTVEAVARPVKVYPNPASDVIYVETQGVVNGQVRIMNLAGVTVRNLPMDDSDRMRIDISDLPAGVYMLQTFNAGQVKDAQRIVIAR